MIQKICLWNITSHSHNRWRHECVHRTGRMRKLLNGADTGSFRFSMASDDPAQVETDVEPQSCSVACTVDKEHWNSIWDIPEANRLQRVLVAQTQKHRIASRGVHLNVVEQTPDPRELDRLDPRASLLEMDGKTHGTRTLTVGILDRKLWNSHLMLDTYN